MLCPTHCPTLARRIPHSAVASAVGTASRHYVTYQRNPKHQSGKRRFEHAKCYRVGNEVKNFNPDKPARFKRTFTELPAYSKWIVRLDAASDADANIPHDKDGKHLGMKRRVRNSPQAIKLHEAKVKSALNLEYLKPLAAMRVPLEEMSEDSFHRRTFRRFTAPCSQLLDHMQDPKARNPLLYLAQFPLSDLPPPLRDDVPPPELLKVLGQGDVYASSLWMGARNTLTPLHRDPNPNLIVQLCGKKVVRLLDPEVGRELYERVKAKLGQAGGQAHMRGEEMMQGKELEKLEKELWVKNDKGVVDKSIGFEVELKKGDGLYIPLGWWHAVRGKSAGPTISVGLGIPLGVIMFMMLTAMLQVNWWFR
ncbi:hypothetical protein ACEQ8H_005374 [Pleosporales sp. CAS-2024a]